MVQYIGNERSNDWTEFYAELLGFQALPDEQRYGILPKGRILKSPCGTFYLQLIEPEPGILDVEGDESLHRIGSAHPMCLPPWKRCASAVSASSKPKACIPILAVR